MLKILPGYDGEPRICERVRSQITAITVKGAWRSPARLQLFAHALAPLADLPVREVIGGSHILTDLTLGPNEVVYDYLTERAQQSTQQPKNLAMRRSRDWNVAGAIGRGRHRDPVDRPGADQGHPLT
jgi:hypothetical protein